ncbi:MAG: AMP-binding protein [Firmicutes bacterium]|nr:AMP-binding protein [Bacillota bacterium]
MENNEKNIDLKLRNAKLQAEQVIENLNTSKNKYIAYKESRPIWTLKQMMETSTLLYGEKTAFMQKFRKDEGYTEISYNQAMDDINGLGTALMKRGQTGKRIGVIGENCYQWAVSYLAAVCGTGVVVPLDKELAARDLKQLIIEAEVTTILFTEKFEKMFRNMAESGETNLELLVNMNAEASAEGVLSWNDLVEDGRRMVKEGERCFLDAQIDPDAMSILLFTSGTTGIAKGVMLCHRNICDNLMVAPTLVKVHPEDIFFSVLPIHHTYECTCGFLMPLYKGASIAYCEGLKYIVKNLQEVKPTIFLGVPLIVETLYKSIIKNIRKGGKEGLVEKVMKVNRLTSKVGLDLNRKLLKDIYKVFGGRMRIIISGGAAIDPDILTFFNDLGFIAIQGYGLTECAPMAALNPGSHKFMRNASVGHLLPGMEVKIADADENGIGEICLKGRNIMMGYYNMPEASAEVLKDGWFHTGDLGYVDSEKFIYITGRKKNVIITANGKNVFPEELEYLLGKIPYVAESLVWAGTEEGSSNNDVIAATIIPDKEEVALALGEEKAADSAEVEKLLWAEVDKINKTLPLFKRIQKIKLREEDFEKTTAKKIKRFVESNK